MSNLLKNLLIALVLAVVLFLGYNLFLAEDDETSLSSATGESQAARETQAFLVRLQSLRAVDINTNVFTDSTFRSLTDFRQEIVDEPTGRANPFAPVQ
jgi:hypothetical protein